MGVVMASKESQDRMVIAVPEIEGVETDVQPYFCLNRLKQDLLLNEDGSFYEKRKPLIKQDYGAAISLTFALEPKATITTSWPSFRMPRSSTSSRRRGIEAAVVFP